MAAARTVIPGIVSNGVIVPQSDAALPEGAQVEIVLFGPEVTPELRSEFDGWERASDEAWAMIDKWEEEEPASSAATSR
jgi:hypothetical protein